VLIGRILAAMLERLLPAKQIDALTQRLRAIINGSLTIFLKRTSIRAE